jgi:signal transduction histidine kinase
VLVAEDDALVVEMIRGMLAEQGYEMVGAVGDGRAAIEAVERLQPDVVVMDLSMPEMDGIEATRRIQEHHPTPVVALTAHDEPELVAGASEAGAGAYVVKPADGQELERAIIVARTRFENMLALRELNQELVARNRELDAFAHTVAHDLKNPLGLVLGYAKLLLMEDDPLDESELRQSLDAVVRNAERMTNIIDELLLLADVRRMERVQLEPLYVGSVVSEALDRVAHLIEGHGAQVKKPLTWPMVMGYAPWLVEVWVNYLSNAIKYGGHPPRIELGASDAQEGWVRLWVRDEGPGLTPEEQERLFTPFVQLAQARATGHGLGLSIVRRIVDKLGGQVGVESELGQGSIFWFTLPVADDF